MNDPGPGSGQPIRVGVNLLWLVPGVVGGSEEYTTRTLAALAAAPPDDLRITLFALAQFAEAHPELAASFDTVTASIDGRRKPERVLVEATWLARQAARHGVDVLHHAGGVVPPGPSRHRSVLTIHDLQPLAHPEHFSPVKRRWLTTMIPRSARAASVVTTPSEPASASVVERLGVDPQRVVTVPHGIDAGRDLPAERIDEVRSRYRLEGPVVLYPAITYPHKDHLTLVAAFARVAARHPRATLVLPGAPDRTEGEVVAAIRASGVGDRVRRLGRIPWPDLAALYATASVVAVPSRFEGFGAPALEAMASGVPVVVANATALPWVVGDAGRLVEPGDVDGFASAIGEILDDPESARAMSAAGLERAGTFTWQRSAEALAGAYRLAAVTGQDGER